MLQPVAFLKFSKRNNIFIYSHAKCFEWTVNDFIEECDGRLDMFNGFVKASLRKCPFSWVLKEEWNDLGGAVRFQEELYRQWEEHGTSFWGQKIWRIQGIAPADFCWALIMYQALFWAL